MWLIFFVLIKFVVCSTFCVFGKLAGVGKKKKIDGKIISLG